ncbi:Candidate membrane protein [Ramlibacter tataouinensis TTB310]|uniref:Candidate membrane protein n=1 Tax=Ramlibacter tataouinensis (strain ATCC BAA-407 / DSM 14655 / LMG 21543 / TTB310) TaxID=365046 RepID=F5Y3J8_RAMTT|nr:Candidate membrane protein [Ramlibacter tataouinensis TTB310]
MIGLIFGATGQATRFCVRGAIADWVIFRGPARLVAWMLAVAIGAACTQLLIVGGTLDATRTLAWAPRLPWASYLFGGALFGFGMVLCGGCPQRNLVKAGAGNLRSVLTLLVVAVAALMTLRGILAGVRVSMFDAWVIQLSGPQDLGSLLAPALHLSPPAARGLLTVLVSAAVLAFAWRVRRSLDAATVLGGSLVGILVGGALFLTGHVGFVAEHPETLEPAWLGTQSRRPEALSFSAPLGHLLDLLTMWSDKSTLLSFGVVVALGVLAGSHASARWRGDFRWEMFSSPREFGAHVAGALLMGFGGVTALGCSIGNGVSGLALLSLGSVLAVLGLTAGTCAALWLQARRAARHDGAAVPQGMAPAASGQALN